MLIAVHWLFAAGGSYSLGAVFRLLIVVASHVAEQTLGAQTNSCDAWA